MSVDHLPLRCTARGTRGQCQRTATTGTLCTRHAKALAPTDAEPFTPAPVSAYDGLDAAGRAEFHVSTMRDFEERASNETLRGDASHLLDRIEGHALRAFIALLEYADEEGWERALAKRNRERAEREQQEAREDAGRRDADPVVAVRVDPDSDRAGSGGVLPAAGAAAGVGLAEIAPIAVDEAERARLQREWEDGWNAYGKEREETAVARRVIEWTSAEPTPEPAAEPGAAVRPRLALSERGVDLYEADWRALAEIAKARGGVDAVIVDKPYSSVTHAGHDDAVDDVRLAGEEKRQRVDRRTGAVYSVGVSRRRTIDYAAWTPADVAEYVATWAPLCRGWFVSITDHVLAKAWEESLTDAGRYVFAPLPLYSPGSRVRLSGDGPSSWTCWIVVARPMTREYFQWGTLPGGYNVAPERMPVVGGKPVSAMRAIVRDYTRPGDLVADSGCGGGTLGVACIAEGRRALLGDRDPQHVEIARKRLLAAPGYQGRLALDVDAPRMTPTGFDFGSTGT